MKTTHAIAITKPRIAHLLTLLALAAITFPIARADETCSSPYLARIDGQEEFVYVWTLGVEGLGDGVGQTCHRRCKTRLAYLRQSHQQRFRRWTQRSAPRRIHRRSPPALARRSREQQDFHLRCPHRSGEAEAWSRRSTISPRPPAARSDRMARMRCPDACSFRVSRTRRTKADALRWSNTATTATTSRPTGCRRRTTRAAQRARSSPMATAMTRAFCRARTRCSPHPSPAGTIT